MRKLYIGSTLVCLIAMLLGAALAWAQGAPQDTQATQGTQEPQGPEPECVIEELRHDLGEVFEQDKYSYTFKVKNTGAGELQIISVKPG